MTTGCYETRVLLFANARRTGTLLTAKCPGPGTHRASNARGLPGVMLAAGIDSHITHQSSELVLARMILLMDQSRSVLPHRSAKAHLESYGGKNVRARLGKQP